MFHIVDGGKRYGYDARVFCCELCELFQVFNRPVQGIEKRAHTTPHHTTGKNIIPVGFRFGQGTKYMYNINGTIQPHKLVVHTLK